MKPLFETAKRPGLLLKFLLCFLSSLLVGAFLNSNAEADTIEVIDLTVHYYSTPSWVTDSSAGFWMFESASNNWPNKTGLPDPPSLGGGHMNLNPGGVTITSEVSVSVTNPSNLYFAMDGNFNGIDPQHVPQGAIFVGIPATGYVPGMDALAWAYGPPWISLGNLAP